MLLAPPAAPATATAAGTISICLFDKPVPCRAGVLLSSLNEPCALTSVPYDMDLYMVGVNNSIQNYVSYHKLETNRPSHSISDAKPHADIVSEADSNDGRSSG